VKTVFDKNTRNELILRINSLTGNSQPLWGKMTVGQMIKHCALWEEMIHQNKKFKRVFIGRLFGKALLKKEMANPTMRKSNPTIPELVVTDTDIPFSSEKEKLIALINRYEQYSHPDYSFVHPFFGKMTREQVGQFAYKHIDHHLRQFAG
jgi:hypothetical protein